MAKYFEGTGNLLYDELVLLKYQYKYTLMFSYYNSKALITPGL